MSTYIKRGNAKRWGCVSSAIVLPITLIGLGILLEYVLRTVSSSCTLNANVHLEP